MCAGDDADANADIGTDSGTGVSADSDTGTSSIFILMLFFPIGGPNYQASRYCGC